MNEERDPTKMGLGEIAGELAIFEAGNIPALRLASQGRRPGDPLPPIDDPVREDTKYKAALSEVYYYELEYGLKLDADDDAMSSHWPLGARLLLGRYRALQRILAKLLGSGDASTEPRTNDVSGDTSLRGSSDSEAAEPGT